MATILRKTLCCGSSWDGKSENNPLRVNFTGAICKECGAAYLLSRDDEVKEHLIDMFLENKELKKFIKELKKISDTCEKCGCNEFLCGHNKRD